VGAAWKLTEAQSFVLNAEIIWEVKNLKNKFGAIAVVITGAIVMLFTLSAFFLLNFEKTAIHWWALAFLLHAELQFFGGIIFSRSLGEKYSKPFVTFGICSSVFLFLILTLICALLVNLFSLSAFILVQIGIISFNAIIVILVLTFSRKIARTNEKDIEKVNVTEPKRGGF
jgi:hypothetical protein